MPSPLTLDIKVFAPAKDFDTSLAFYQALGWELIGKYDSLAELQLGDHRFFLQDYYQKDWAENFMFYIHVKNVQSWYEHIEKALANGHYEGARVVKPNMQDHGHMVCFLHDPSGILLHFAQDVSKYPV